VTQKSKIVFYLEKVPGDLYKGFGWIKIESEVAKQFKIPCQSTELLQLNNLESYCCLISLDNQAEYFQSSSLNQNLIPLPVMRGVGKKFLLDCEGKVIPLFVQKSLSINSVCQWVKTWASGEAKLVTPGGKTVSLEEDSTSKAAFVYFVLNRDSRAIKIGMATNVEKRLKSLQTSSPILLEVLKTIQLNNIEQAQNFEAILHHKFSHLRMNGEWFKVSEELTTYIRNCPSSYSLEINFLEPRPYRSVLLSEL